MRDVTLRWHSALPWAGAGRDEVGSLLRRQQGGPEFRLNSDPCTVSEVQLPKLEVVPRSCSSVSEAAWSPWPQNKCPTAQQWRDKSHVRWAGRR